MAPRILIVEDEDATARKESLDLSVLDFMLPKMDGMAVPEGLRQPPVRRIEGKHR